MKSKLASKLAIVLYLAGGMICFYPDMKLFLREQKDKEVISEFEHKKTEEHAEVRNQMEQYNLAIYEEGQSELKDAWSYEKEAIEGWKDGVIGTIVIPKMDVEIPLYIGANRQHLRDGAAVLTQTSMPIGGNNTNSVIAAHRGGFYGAAMFKDIETLEHGDQVTIKNMWETLHYEVSEMVVIQPDEIDKVKIVDGEDMLTLITCHPYPYDYSRYVVYCNRVGKPTLSDQSKSEPIYQSSQNKIAQEEVLQTVAKWVFLGITLCWVLLKLQSKFIHKKKNKNNYLDIK